MSAPAKNQNPAEPKSGVRITAAIRRVEAMRLRQEGFSYKEIGEQLQCTSKNAWRIVHEEFARIRAEQNELAVNLLQLTKDRLDRLMSVYYDKAMRGDRFAADLVVKLVDRQTRLFGLEAPKRTLADISVTRTDDPERLKAQARMQGIETADLEALDDGEADDVAEAAELSYRSKDRTGRDEEGDAAPDGL